MMDGVESSSGIMLMVSKQALLTKYCLPFTSQRGRLPHYVAPPELKEEDVAEVTDKESSKEEIKLGDQNLDAIGEEHMEKEEIDDEDEAGDGDGKPRANEQKETAEADASNSDDEEEKIPTKSLIAAGEWED